MRYVGWGAIIALVAVVGGLFMAAGFGLVPVDAVSSPPKWEEAIAGYALDHAIARKAARLHDPFEANEDNLRAGMVLYEHKCAGCHGDGKGTSVLGPKGFYPRIPQFGADGFDLSAQEAFVVAKYGIRYSAMPGWNGVMADDDIWRVTTFLSHLSSLPPSVAAAWQGPPK